MRIVFISTPTFEAWDFQNPDTQGIGGSETSHIEMARRLAERGHDVDSFAPVPWKEETRGGPGRPGGELWHPFETLNPKSDLLRDADVVIVYRAPCLADFISHPNMWLVCQDVDYQLDGNELTDDRAVKFSRIVALCKTQAQYLGYAHPIVKDRVCVSSNGIKAEYIRELVAVTSNELGTGGTALERNPHRLMYASSPDRGLEYLLKIFSRAREVVSDLELHVFYGFNNMDKVAVMDNKTGKAARDIKASILKAMEQAGVIHHGRLPQKQLLEEWFKSGIWCHASNFTETSCITSMDAQACGAIPITQPTWAVAENVKHGVFIDGDVRHSLIQARYSLELVKLALDAERQETIRREMMPWALNEFHWDKWVDQWEEWATARKAVAA